MGICLRVVPRVAAVARGPNGVILASTVGIILYVIGIPASMFYLVYSARKNQDERALDQLSILHLVYKPNWWYTEVIVCLEKCTIAGVLVFVKDVMKQAALGLAVSGFWLFFFASAHPFRERRDNIIKDLCCLAQILVMLGVILLQIKTQSEDSPLANYSQNDIDIILIVVVCAPVAALIGPWLVHVIRNRCRALRKYFFKDSEEKKALTTEDADEDLDELGRPRLGKGPDASTTRLTLPGQDDPPARVDEPPVEVPLQGSSPEGRGGCAIA